jgi:hypothetical protein
MKGTFSREGHEVQIERDATTGTVTYELWCKDGKLDRADGPAFIERAAATGIVTREEWWKDGDRIAPPITKPTQEEVKPIKKEQEHLEELNASCKKGPWHSFSFLAHFWLAMVSALFSEARDHDKKDDR